MALSPFALKAIAAGVATTPVVGLGVIYRQKIDNFFRSSKLPEEKINQAADKNDGWTLTKDETNKTLKLAKINLGEGKGEIQECVITVSGDGNLDTIRGSITTKLGSSTPNEDNKKYRRGFLKKCSESNYQLSLTGTDISGLFDFSLEKITDDDKNLIKSGTWTVQEPTVSEVNGNSQISLGVQINVVADNTNKYTCKILGELASTEKTKLEASKTDIKTSLGNHLTSVADANKESERTKFLERCKRSFNEEIRWELSKKSDDENKYELKDLNSLFS